MELKRPEIEIEKTVDKPIYINSANIISSYFDFQFMFLNNVIDPNSNIIKSQELLKIVMSPQHTKVFCNLLQDQINKYELEFGELKLPNLAKLDEK